MEVAIDNIAASLYAHTVSDGKVQINILILWRGPCLGCTNQTRIDQVHVVGCLWFEMIHKTNTFIFVNADHGNIIAIKWYVDKNRQAPRLKESQ